MVLVRKETVCEVVLHKKLMHSHPPTHTHTHTHTHSHVPTHRDPLHGATSVVYTLSELDKHFAVPLEVDFHGTFLRLHLQRGEMHKHAQKVMITKNFFDI